MNLDTDPMKRLERLPPKLRAMLFCTAGGLGSYAMLFVGVTALDLRRPLYGQNHHLESVWERVPLGCVMFVLGVICGTLTLHGIWKELIQPALKTRTIL